MITLAGVNKYYRNGGTSLHVLKNLDLTIEAGESVAIMGSSGSGKSTLLNILGTLDRYDSGTYHLAGRLVRDLEEGDAAQVRNQLIGFVFQAFNLLPFKTALENVALPLYYRGIRRRQRHELARAYLERVGLADRADHLPSQLSGGQRQRVAVARALITHPQVVFADEPTGALDTESSHRLMDLLEELNAEGITLVVVTHEADVAARMRRTIRMRDGRIAA